ncbi:MAG: formylglycine-generating enzyme family protein [Fibrobacter sp.]|nr:formylglycine-generating enzyme family protein [Fibrobacter sp.]
MRIGFPKLTSLLVLFLVFYAFAQSDYTEALSGLSGSSKTLDMVFVKGGTYERGCSSGDNKCESQEKPAHTVTVSDFYIGKYELTNAQWEAVMGDNTSKDNKPKTGITWYDAIEFTCKLSQATSKQYRLLTDAEFEFAARGGTKSKGYLYSGSNNADDVAWHAGNLTETCFGEFCFRSVQDVGTKAPNELGIYDLSGNVYEWMYDSYGTFSGDNLVNPIGPATIHTQKVRRGGSYDQPASESRVSGRKIRSIEGKDGSIGLRLALSADGARPDGMLDPCTIEQPVPTGGKPGFHDDRLINAEGEAWVNEMGLTNILIVKENSAIYTSTYGNFTSSKVEGQWYSLNSMSLNIVPSSGAEKKYIYYLIDHDNLSMMPEGGMPGRYYRRQLSEINSDAKAPTIANPKTPEQLAPAGYNIDMNNPPTDGRDPRLIEGPNQAWLQDNIAMGAGGTHRYRFDFDNEDYTRFYVYDPPSYTSLAKGSWFTVDNTFLRILDDNGKVYDYLYTVTPDGKTYYHISFQSYEPGDFRMFEKVDASAVPAWKEPSASDRTFDQGSSTYIPPSESNTVAIKKPLNSINLANPHAEMRYYDLKGKPLGASKPQKAGLYILRNMQSGVAGKILVK